MYESTIMAIGKNCVVSLVTVLCFCGPAIPAQAQLLPRGKAAATDDKPQWIKEPIKAPHLHYKKFLSATIKGEVSYLIYLPPGYEKDVGTRYPVVYWLHGKGGSQQGVPLMCDRLTKAIEMKQAPPMIVVYPNGLNLSGWADSAGQPVETVCIQELLPLVDKTYRTIAAREGRLVGTRCSKHTLARAVS